MRQTDFTVGNVLRCKRDLRRRLLFLRASNAPYSYQLRIIMKDRRLRRDIKSINLRSLSISINSFNISIYSDESALRDFRFQIKDLARISDTMGWVYGKTERNGYTCVPFTACCILLRRMASPCRWADVEYLFGMRSSTLSEVLWEVLESFYEAQGHLLLDLKEGLLVQRAEMCADSITNAGAPLDSFVGFIDCTKIKMTRPGGHGGLQRSCYSGHKRFHCLIYQAVTTPDGLLFNLYGPEVGRRHDLTLLRQSGLQDSLQNCLHINGRQFYIYVDAAYVLKPWLQVAFPRAGASLERQILNTRMSGVRIAVEWNYKDLKQLWSLNDFPRALKVRQGPIGLIYTASALLINFKTCLEGGGQVQAYFKCPPPPSLSTLTQNKFTCQAHSLHATSAFPQDPTTPPTSCSSPPWPNSAPPCHLQPSSPPN